MTVGEVGLAPLMNGVSAARSRQMAPVAQSCIGISEVLVNRLPDGRRSGSGKGRIAESEFRQHQLVALDEKCQQRYEQRKDHQNGNRVGAANIASLKLGNGEAFCSRHREEQHRDQAQTAGEPDQEDFLVIRADERHVIPTFVTVKENEPPFQPSGHMTNGLITSR